MNKSKLICATPLYKVMLVRDASVLIANRSIRNPANAAKIVTDYLLGTDREHFVGLYLSSTNCLITIHTVSVGTLNASLVHPREVFKLACMVNAASVIVSHNHPSEDIEPSREDIRITKQLVEAGKILDIPLYDHLIVSERNGYLSFRERGLM
jgi:DNA repair protein RadC